MKNTLILLLFCASTTIGLAQHHKYIGEKLRVIYVHDMTQVPGPESHVQISPTDRSVGGELARAFWQNPQNAATIDFLEKLFMPATRPRSNAVVSKAEANARPTGQAIGGDFQLQRAVRGILSITDKIVELYLYNDNKNHKSVHPDWATKHIFCKGKNNPLTAWPCASRAGASASKFAGYIAIGNHFLFMKEGLSTTQQFHHRLYTYETFVHELTHTQFRAPLENTLRKLDLHKYGDDKSHFNYEFLPSKNAAFNEAIADGFAMYYRKANDGWNQAVEASASLTDGASSTKSTGRRKGRNFKVPSLSEIQKLHEQLDYKTKMDVITWFNQSKNIPTYIDVNKVCTAENKSPHCLIQRLADVKIIPKGEAKLENGQAIKLYDVMQLPPHILLHGEMVQANIFSDYMMVFSSNLILIQAVDRALKRIPPRGFIDDDAFGIVFEEMIRAVETINPHNPQAIYMPLFILDFYTGFKMDSFEIFKNALGQGKYRLQEGHILLKLNAYWTKEHRTKFKGYWEASGGQWSTNLLVKVANDLNVKKTVN